MDSARRKEGPGLEDLPPRSSRAATAPTYSSCMIDQVTDRPAVSDWIAAYESAWRTPGTAGLARLFTGDASYLLSPYEQPVVGLDAIAQMWDEQRDGPDEVFSLTTQILAVDGAVAVVRAEVRYGEPVHQEYRDLWLLNIGDDGLCSWFEEWPYWPRRPFSASAEPR